MQSALSNLPHYPTNYFPYFSTAFTVTVIALNQLNPTFFETYISIPVIVGCVTLLGIPHGALDHVVFYQLYQETPDAINEKQSLVASLSRSVADFIGSSSNIFESPASDDKETEPLLQKSHESDRGQSQMRSNLMNVSTTLCETKDVRSSFAMKLVFYFNYLAIMLAWTVMWAIAPVFCFWAFLAVSAFHFGQVQFLPFRHPSLFSQLSSRIHLLISNSPFLF
jgi:hypothetical protein